MKRDREVFGQKTEPPWLNVLLNYNKFRHIVENVPVHDPRFEWDRVSYVPALFGGQRNVCNKMLPLGMMIKYQCFALASEFVDALEISVHEPCCWFDGHPYTPLEWALHLGVLTPECAELLWRAGLSARSIPFKADPRRLVDYQARGRIGTCGEMENGIMAMVWCCKQVSGTEWGDISSTVAGRMRRVSTAVWMHAKNRLGILEWTKVQEED